MAAAGAQRAQRCSTCGRPNLCAARMTLRRPLEGPKVRPQPAGQGRRARMRVVDGVRGVSAVVALLWSIEVFVAAAGDRGR